VTIDSYWVHNTLCCVKCNFNTVQILLHSNYISISITFVVDRQVETKCPVIRLVTLFLLESEMYRAWEIE